MKANELMTGDWVQVKDCIDQSYYFDEYEPGEIVQVREILDNGINPDWAGAEVSSILGLEDIQPIPITQEILKRIGFKKDKGGEESWYSKAGWMVPNKYNRKAEPISWEVEIIGKFKSFDGVIKYVHQLQHALQLCGIDKEIVL